MLTDSGKVENASARVRFAALRNAGDLRGDSFTLSGEILSFLEGVADIHIAYVIPTAVRGNHFHSRRREVLVILHQSEWSLLWDEGEGTPIHKKVFQGSGAEVVLIEPGSSHAVQNTGEHALTLLGLSPEPYDPQETIRRPLT